MLRTITYVSTAYECFTQDELVLLLQNSRDANQNHEITGMLLYDEGNFIQTIEGPEEAIERLYANIQADTRHYSVTTLIDDPLDERVFPDWSMGFAHLARDNVTDIPGFTNFMRLPHQRNAFLASPSEAKRLLSVFSSSAVR